MTESQPLERLIDLAEVLRQTGLGKTRVALLGRVLGDWKCQR